MKKISTLLVMAAMAALPFTFTSCDDDDYWYGDYTPWWYDYDDGGYGWDDNYYDDNYDDGNLTIVDEAQVLNGMWNGTIVYTNGSDGTTDYFYATMTFVQNATNEAKGVGTEYDYYLNADNTIAKDQTLNFTWYIKDNGDIYVKYESGSTFVMDMNASQHGFYLDEKTGVFRGYMVGTNNNDMMKFDFTRQTAEAKGAFGKTAVKHNTSTFGFSGISRITTTGKMSLPKNRK